MPKSIEFLLIFLLLISNNIIFSQEKAMNYNKLTAEEERVILHKGTEQPFTGKYYKHSQNGTYVCKRCDTPLYRSVNKFDSHCGWPSFDDEILGAIRCVPDADWIRTEIICNSCEAHLGHVFMGERLTTKNIRHCVNSISLKFIPAQSEQSAATAYFAGGCFWGMEYLFQKEKGVIDIRVGYMGGHKKNPSYQDVCDGASGHAEIIEVVYDTSQTTYEKMARFFFEIHDPTQLDRQGPDIGEQYRSEIFYTNAEQNRIATKLIKILADKGYKIATKVTLAGQFWEAESYHQDYYLNTGKKPYCHLYQKRF